MKQVPEGHGNTAPGELGPPIERQPRELTDPEKRALKRQAEGMVHTEGGYRIWTDKDGKMHTEPLK